MDFNFIPLAFGQILDPTTAAYAIAAVGLAVHFGFTGLLNFGQAGFMAIGAYAFGVTAINYHWPVWASGLAVLVATTLFALILGIPTLRLRADYLSIVTIAASEIVRLGVKTPELNDITGGPAGLNGAGAIFYQQTNPLPAGRFGFGVLTYTANDWWIRIVAWVIVAIAVLIVFLLMRSPWGRVIRGIREDEDAVRALGKNVYSYKMQALILGGIFGGLGGAIFIIPGSLQPDNYGTQTTFFLYTILLLGGAATVFGPVVGSIIFWVVLLLTEGLLSLGVAAHVLPISTIQVGPIRFIIVGVALMLLVIFRPQGIFGKKSESFFNA
jgi:branched-chain amino acid transport system permease protein